MSQPAPKPTIAAIKPYVAGKAKAAGFAQPIKLSANENALGASPRAREAFLETAGSLHLYPDPAASALRDALAERHDLDPSRIVFGTGSDEIFSMVCQAFLNPGDVMVQPYFAFAAWAIAARAAGAEVKSAPERNYTVDVDAMLEAVDARTRVMFVANPASPTGTRLPFAEIERLHAGLRSDVLLVLDGAYAEFAQQHTDYADGLALARAAANVIVTRTFSKLYGLAALRLGWGYAAGPIVDALQRIRLPFNASAPAQAAAVASLADADFTARALAHTTRWRVALTRFVAELGLEPIPASANFVTVRIPAGFPLSAAELDQELMRRGILVRNLTSYAMPDCLRISVGLDAELEALQAALLHIAGRARS